VRDLIGEGDPIRDRGTAREMNRPVVAGGRSCDDRLPALPLPPSLDMLSRVRTAALWGLEAFPVECEVDVGPGLPGFTLVGLPDPSVREVRDRVWPALRNAGFRPPDRRVTVNLAPAGRRKEGAGVDLAVAIGLLAATEQVPLDRLSETAAIGELALDGTLRPVRGTLSLAEAAWRDGAARLLCARAGAPEAALVEGLEVLPATSILDVALWLRGETLSPQAPAPPDAPAAAAEDLAEVRGQTLARRALEIAAAGGHHLLMVGCPGAGKSMLARRLPGILPPLSSEEALVVTRLHSAAGMRPPGRGLMTRRPFRAPHHSLSRAALIGGGSPPRPGELSLAHHGVLFMDEFSQYSHHLLDALREPLETGSVWISRANAVAEFPARALIVGAMNP
jgi:magnesium chelatase family protein